MTRNFKCLEFLVGHIYHIWHCDTLLSDWGWKLPLWWCELRWSCWCKDEILHCKSLIGCPSAHLTPVPVKNRQACQRWILPQFTPPEKACSNLRVLSQNVISLNSPRKSSKFCRLGLYNISNVIIYHKRTKGCDLHYNLLLIQESRKFM